MPKHLNKVPSLQVPVKYVPAADREPQKEPACLELHVQGVCWHSAAK
jgi:hypothetical protein